MKWLGATLVVVALGTGLAAAACGSDDPVIQPPQDGGIMIAPNCDLLCSSDLHEVRDCNENVIKRCAEGEGCKPGGDCVPACDSARLNKSTLGCEYYSVAPGTDGAADGSCFAAFVANTWTTTVALSVSYDGKDLDVSTFARVPVGSGPGLTYQPLLQGQLAPGQVAILFLADFAAAPGVQFPTRCPPGVTAAVSTGLVSSGESAIIKAFSIKSTAPVVAYDMFPYGGAKSFVTSATLLVPIPAWGDNYIGVIGYPRGPAPGPTVQPFLQIVASDDATDVTVRAPLGITGGPTVPASPAGTPMKYTLGKGQVLQLKQDADLTGSVIQATKPVGLWGGSSCMYIEPTDNACDSGHQQLVPARALGSKYVAARHKDRLLAVEEAPPWRLVGVVDGTTLTYEPAAPPGAPIALKTGEVIGFRATGPFVVKSQDPAHPFYMSAHMTGQQSSGKDFLVGDPEFVSVVPAEQWLRSYVFMTDPTMSFTNLVVVRTKGSKGFADVELDCSGKIGGWQSAGNADFEVARVDLVAGGKPVGACDNGRHSMRSDQPFGLTVWGYDYTVSYAYPAGASVKPINEVVIPAIR